jgi:arsenate reductase
MLEAIFFHNPRCSKSRQALALLQERKDKFEVFMYLDEKLEKDFLKEIIQKLGMSPRDLLRTGESAYKENNLKDSNISEEEIINLMIEYPKLIERPIYVKGSKAIVGRPPENVLKII